MRIIHLTSLHLILSHVLTSFRRNWVRAVIGRSHDELGRFTAHDPAENNSLLRNVKRIK